MPKVRIDEYSDFFSAKNEVRFAWDRYGVRREVNFTAPQLSRYFFFRPSILRPDVDHVPSALGFGQVIHGQEGFEKST